MNSKKKKKRSDFSYTFVFSQLHIFQAVTCKDACKYTVKSHTTRLMRYISTVEPQDTDTEAESVPGPSL